MSRYLDKSRKVSTNLEKSQQISKSLDKSQKSWQSRFVLTISINNSTKINLDWKISILKILTEKKKSWSRRDRKSRHLKNVSLNTKDVLDLDLDWSRLSRPPRLGNYLFCIRVNYYNIIFLRLKSKLSLQSLCKSSFF